MTATAAPVQFLGPPARATDQRGAAALAAEARVIAPLVAGDGDLRALAALAHRLGAAGAANLLVPHVVLPALLLEDAALTGSHTTALGDGDEDLDTAHLSCTLTGDRLDGVKPLVSGLLDTDRAVVAATRDGAVVLALVDLGGEGALRRPVATIGRGRDGELRLERALALAVVEPEVAAGRLARATAVTALVQAAEGAGMIHALLELCLRQGHDRHAFARPVGSFQAFQHACADMAMERELADTIVDRAAACGDPADATRARAFAAAAAVRASRTAVQLHGGKGFLDDHEVARLYRLAKESQLRWGSEHWHLRRIADQLAEG